MQSHIYANREYYKMSKLESIINVKLKLNLSFSVITLVISLTKICPFTLKQHNSKLHDFLLAHL